MNDPSTAPTDAEPEADRSATVTGVVTASDEPAKPSRMKRALTVSLLVHAVLLVVLLVWYLPKRDAGKKAAALASAAAKQVMQKDARPTPKPPPELMAPKPGDDVPADQIKKSIESQMEAIKKLRPEVKLSELEKNLKRLKSLANEKSVEQVTQKIGTSLGLDTQTYQPKESAAEGRFDLKTAQLSDVTRQQGKNGQWEYEATLVDAEGHTTTVEMAAAEGATMHDLFAKMKKYPMAAGIYRSVVMPMLQKIIEAEKVAKKAAREAEQMNAQDAAN